MPPIWASRSSLEGCRAGVSLEELPDGAEAKRWLPDVAEGRVTSLDLAVLYPKTRHALSGMTRGWVDEQWALEHHRAWAEETVRRRG